MSAKSSSTRSVFGILIARIGLMPVTFAVGVLVARILGPEDRGVYSFLLLTGGTILPLLMMGFGQSIVYLISSARYDSKNVLVTIMLLGLVQGSVMSALIAGLWHAQWLGETARAIPGSVFIPILIALPARTLVMYLRRIALGRSQFGLVNNFEFARQGLRAATLTVFVVGMGMGVMGAAIALVVADTLELLSLSALLIPKIRPRLRLEWAFISEGFNYGLRSWMAGLAGRATLRLDQLLLAFFAAPEALGIYAIASRAAELMRIPASAVLPVLFNRIAAADDEAERRALLERVHRLVMLVSFALATGQAVIVPWLIPTLFGPEYESAVVPCMILLPGMVAVMSKRVTTKFFAGVGRPGRGAIAQLWGLGASILAYGTLVPLYGVTGAAVGSTLAYLVRTVAALVLYRNMTAPARNRMLLADLDDLRWAAIRVRSVLKRRG